MSNSEGVPTVNKTSADQVWGLWPTIGFSMAIVGVFIVLQSVAAVLFLLAKGLLNDSISGDIISGIEMNGLLISISTITTAVACTGLVLLFAKLRNGAPIRAYLLLYKPDFRGLLPWFLLVVAVALVYDFSKLLFDLPLVPEVMIKIYRTAEVIPLLWIAIVIAGPVFEEIFFRGFVFTGLANSRLGANGAILLTAVLWAVIHIQYGWLEIGFIVVIGVLLGYTRVKTGSVVGCMLLHMAMNLVAMVETAYYA